MKQPNQYEAPTHSHTRIHADGETLHYNLSDVRKESLGATDPDAYVSTLVKVTDGYLNSDEWREEAAERTPCEFRPTGA
ncbi:hypothetical protein D3C76_1095480 [compost metagenome]